MYEADAVFYSGDVFLFTVRQSIPEWQWHVGGGVDDEQAFGRLCCVINHVLSKTVIVCSNFSRIYSCFNKELYIYS